MLLYWGGRGGGGGGLAVYGKSYGQIIFCLKVIFVIRAHFNFLYFKAFKALQACNVHVFHVFP